MDEVLLTPLRPAFYQRHPAEVAPELLGMWLVRQVDEGVLAGRIVEVEAYSSEDPASHCYRGLNQRNRAMFGEVGRAYIYFIHGLHYCVNVTARLQAPAGGVLIRALEPRLGVEVMKRLRRRDDPRQLASGPAKLTQAMRIDMSLYGTDMTRTGPLYIAVHEDNPESTAVSVKATPRIGISRAAEVPWRFVVQGSRFLSR